MFFEFFFTFFGLASLFPSMARFGPGRRIAAGSSSHSRRQPLLQRAPKRRRGRTPSPSPSESGSGDESTEATRDDESPPTRSPTPPDAGQRSGSGETSSSGGGEPSSSSSGEGSAGGPHGRGVSYREALARDPHHAADEAALLAGLARSSDDDDESDLRADNERLRNANLELQALLESTQARADRLEGAMGERVAINPSACVNAEARLAVGISKVILPKETAMHNARIVPKPKPFDGFEGKGSAVTFRNWFSDVQRFVFAVTWSAELLVPTAASFLVGDALRWWERQSIALARKGLNVLSWTVFADALFERWAQQNEEAAARTKLHYLKQDAKPIQDHLRRFEALYALIPCQDPTSIDMEKDKIHRFFLSCNAEWQSKIATSPAGSKWESFQAVSNYIITHIADKPVVPANAERIHKAVKDTRIAPSAWVAGRRHSIDSKQGSRRRRSIEGPSSATRPADDAGAGPSRPRVHNPRPFTNGAGAQFLRNKNVAQYCITNKLCICCYEPECHVRTCRKNPAPGVPLGYLATPTAANPPRRQGPQAGQ